MEVTNYCRLWKTMDRPDKKEWFNQKSMIALVENKFLRSPFGDDDDKLVVVTKWSHWETQMVEISQPSISRTNQFVTFKHLGDILVDNLKEIPLKPTDKRDNHVESSWLRFIGRECKCIAEFLKHDLVLFGKRLPLNTLKGRFYFYEDVKDSEGDKKSRRSQT